MSFTIPTIEAIKHLQLFAKKVVTGFLSGIHANRMLGSGMEFSQYRTYQPGDDLRLLDWKLYARSDKMFVKQSETERNINVCLLLDASNSMNYTENKVSKFNYAKMTAAALAYLAYLQGDRIGLGLFNQKEQHTLPPKNSPKHLNHFFYLLENTPAQSKWTDQLPPFTLQPFIRSKSLVLLFSDFYEQKQELINFIQQLLMHRQEVIVFHLSGAKELSLDYDGLVEFVDLESKEKIQLHTKDFKHEYAQTLQAVHQNIQNQLQAKNCHYEPMLLHQPIEQALRLFLQKR